MRLGIWVDKVDSRKNKKRDREGEKEILTIHPFPRESWLTTVYRKRKREYP